MNLALEAETAIFMLPQHARMYIRCQVACSVKNINRRKEAKRCINQKSACREKKLLHQIKQKLSAHKAIISKADEGNSIVIRFEKDYQDKVGFISNNKFQLLIEDPTSQSQRTIKKTINEGTVLFSKDR
jgi:hypothetical protein